MAAQQPLISVGILTEKKIEFELYGEFNSYGMKNNFSGKYSAQLVNDKIVCTKGVEKTEISNEIIFEPKETGVDSFLIRDVIIGNKFHWQKKERERFTGSLKLIKSKNKIVAINILPIEDYLTSVISSEMSAKCPVEALKAHAVISRSWILSQFQKSKGQKSKIESNTETEHIKWYDREEHELFDVCNDDHCQRYHGVTKIFTSAVSRVIEETKGIVLMNGKEICDARYSKACGGISEAFENTWEPVEHSYLKPVIDYKYEPENLSLDFSKEKNAVKWISNNVPAFCNTNDQTLLSQILVDFDQSTLDFYRWKVIYSQEEISKIIAEKSGIDFGEIIDMVPLERGASGRIIKLKICGTKKELIVGKELEIRKYLSKSHLYSSAFFVEKTNIKNKIPQRFIITGAGWGHGVGLCQIGAAVMASQGYKFDEILLHYFIGVRLKKIY